MLAPINAFLLGLLIMIAPWFHGLTGFHEQLWTQLIIYAFFIAMILIPAGLQRLPMPSFTNPFDRAALASFVFAGAYTLFSVLPAYSLMTLIRYGSVLAVYVVARQCLSRAQLRLGMAVCFIGMGILYSVYGLMQYYGSVPKEYWYSPSLASRYVNSGHFAALLVMPFYMSISLITQPTKKGVKFLAASAAALFCAVLILTDSRTIWISLATCLLIYLGMIIKIGRISLKKTWMAIGAAGFCMALFFSSRLWSSVLDRFSQIWDGNHANLFSILQRFSFWEGAAHAMMQRPWGWGLGTFVHIYPQFKTHASRFLVDYAHNEILQWGVDTGIIGILFLLALLTGYLGVCARYLRNSKIEPRDKIEFLGNAACVLTMLMASQFDFPLRIYANALLMAIILGGQACLVDSLERADPEKKKRISR